MPLRTRLLLSTSIAVVAACGGRTDGGPAGANETVFIRAVQRLEPPDCIAKADPAETFLDRGSLDTALSPRYTAWFLVGNRAYDPNDVGGSIATISAADVTVFDLSLPAHDPVATFSLDATGSADGASSSSDPGYGLAAVEVMPPSVTQIIRARLDANPLVVSETFEVVVALRGTFVGGTSFRTVPYVLDVDVCDGCSVIFPVEASDPTVRPYPNCLREVSVEPFVNQACLPGQDGQTDCRSCVGRPACTLCQFKEDCPAGSTCGTNGVCR